MKDKIYWAFDAFEDGLKTNIFVGETLASLNERLKAEIYPAYVLGSEIMDTSPAFVLDTMSAMTKVADERMQSVLNKIRIPGILPPRALVEHSFSRSQLVKKFINEAEKEGATLIAVGSHGRKGFDRAVLGSFAETLLLQSHLPVLVVGQNFGQVPHWDKILFATDFSDDSSFAFHKVLDLANTLSSSVTLFHHVSPMIDPIIQSAIAPFGGVWTTYKDEMKNLVNRKEQALEEWKRKAQGQGVAIKTVLDSGLTDTSQAILSYAKDNNVGLVAMGAQSGALSTILFGAISRKVVREAECPVWILRRR